MVYASTVIAALVVGMIGKSRLAHEAFRTSSKAAACHLSHSAENTVAGHSRPVATVFVHMGQEGHVSGHCGDAGMVLQLGGALRQLLMAARKQCSPAVQVAEIVEEGGTSAAIFLRSMTT
jgi:hypothetical protein